MLEEDDRLDVSFYPGAVTVGEFPNDRTDPTVAACAHLGGVLVHFTSPVQMCDLGVLLSRAADQWQDELFRMAREGVDYKLPRRLAEEETPADHRLELHDDGLDGTEWDHITPGDVATA